MMETGPVLWLAGGWAAWCAVHSLLISRTFTDWLHRRLGEQAAWFRLGYVLFSAATLLPLLVLTLTAPQQPLFAWPGPWRAVQAVLLGYSLLMFLGGARRYDLAYFTGLRQIRALRQGKSVPAPEFRTGGILRFVRHPWYSGGLALVWAAGPVTTVNLAVKLILSLYLVVGTLLEERKLVAVWGEAYRQYQRRVPRLIPWRRPR